MQQTENKIIMNNIFFTSPSTGQSFTNIEWHNYIKDHPDSREIVKRVGQYGYNIFGVCITPKQVIHWQNKSDWFTVGTAQSDNGRWNFDLAYQFGHNIAGGEKAYYSSKYHIGYETEREAIIAALDSLLNHTPNCKSIINIIKRFRAETMVVQLTLF